MTTPVPPTSSLPLNAENLDRLQTETSNCLPLQLAWVAGYFWGRVSECQPAVSTMAISPPSITVLSASQTGNARRLAEKMRDDLISAKLNVAFINAGDYKFKHIEQEKSLLVITSTQGEGDPPEEAVALYNYLFSKKAPSLQQTQFSVFGLGDSSYKHFAKIGKDFDRRLAELGAQRLYERVDADVEYLAKAKDWRDAMVTLLKTRVTEANQAPQLAISGNDLQSNYYTKEAPLKAHLSVNLKITRRQSLKDVRHLEIDLAGSGLCYQPGDALGVWYENDPELIKELLKLLWLKGNEAVEIAGQTLPLSEVLQKHYELTKNTPDIVDKYANLAKNEALLAIINDNTRLTQFVLTTPIVDMVRRAPIALRADQLLALLRPITPRVYSISSAQAEVGEEVHITVGVVRYEVNGRTRTGGCSGYLADRLAPDDEMRVFVEYNENFRLPNDSNVPIIMIGPGSGIAPFLAFMQQRDADSAPGQNWLFFGNPHLTDDFLYKIEWQRYIKNGLLTNIDVAWSRDQAQKGYVQDRIREKGDEVWRWLQQGAHIYVCGDASSMARDVEQALVNLIAEHGSMDSEQADDFLSELRINRRYQRDVY